MQINQSTKNRIAEKLKAVGADGLCISWGSCGCEGNNLGWCDEIENILTCQPAKIMKIKDHCKPENCSTCHNMIGCKGYDKACERGLIIHIPCGEMRLNKYEG